MTDHPELREAAPALVVRGLSKHYGARAVLRAVDLEVAPGEIHALLGQNGSGKSTLIKVLSGYHEPDTDGGSVQFDGRELPFGDAHASYVHGCRVVHQDLGLIDDMPVLDNVLFAAGYDSQLGTIQVKAARRRVRAALDGLGLDGVDERARVGTLSPNHKTGVAIARALLADAEHPPSVLVLDEPTATFPEAEVRHLHAIVRRVAEDGVAVLYVTHRLDEVWQLCDSLSVLRDGVKVASRPANSIMRRELIGLMVGTELDDASEASDELRPASGAPVLIVDGLAAPRLRHVSFTVRPGEIVGIAGITGSGRESLLETIFGAEPADSGRVVVDGNEIPLGGLAAMVKAGVGMVPADRKRRGCILTLSARHNVMLSDLSTAWRWPKLRRDLERAETRRWIDALDVRPAGSDEMLMQSFSGGNQQKLVLAKWLRREPRVLLVDEPTQGVDVGARIVLHRALVDAAQHGAAVVVASTDVDELVAICQRVLVMANGSITGEIEGDALTTATVSSRSLHDADRRMDETAYA